MSWSMEFQRVYAVGHVNRELETLARSFVMRETGTERERRRAHLSEYAQCLSDIVTLAVIS